MSEAIIAALVTGGCAVISQIIISARSTKDLYDKLDKQSEIADEKIRGEIALIKAEIQELRKNVEKHNGVIERTYSLEKEQAKQAEQIKTLFSEVRTNA